MKKTLFLICLTAAGLTAQTNGTLPSVSDGRIERWSDFPSRYVSPRNIDVWLPPGYDGKDPCPVIYMHDGQMLFDAQTTWNKTAWGMADTLARLIRDGKMPNTIIVGIWSIGPQRFREYFPEKAMQFMPEAFRERFIKALFNGRPQADDYLRFLVRELKPAMDRKYATRQDRDHTVIMGSSMGGLISLYAVCEYPGTFGAAGCLSTHWAGMFEKNATVPLALFNYLQGHIPDPLSHRLYFDHGTETLDALYGESQSFADILFREKGYSDSTYQSRIFPGDAHTETAWAQRVAIPLEFLFGH